VQGRWWKVGEEGRELEDHANHDSGDPRYASASGNADNANSVEQVSTGPGSQHALVPRPVPREFIILQHLWISPACLPSVPIARSGCLVAPSGGDRRLAGPCGARSVVAESVLVKHQLLILNRSRRRAPNLYLADCIVASVCALLIRAKRLIRSAIVLNIAQQTPWPLAFP
jgi:hypothetical protein